jgi:hypothetical protein
MTGALAPAAAAPTETPPVSKVAERPWARWAELTVLGFGLLYSLVFWVRLPTQLPTDADYLALQAAMQQDVRSGDAAAVLPFWADHAKVYLHGIPILGLPNLDTELDAERYARLWVVAQPSLPRSDASDTLAGLSRRLDVQGSPRRFGPLELWLFAPKPGRVVTWDFVAHPGDTQVQSNGPVQIQWREFDFLPRRCYVISGSQATLRFASVSVVHGLRVGLGVAPGGGAQLAGSIDGRPLQPFAPATGGSAFQTHELPIEGIGPGDHVVELEVRGRGACLDAVAY